MTDDDISTFPDDGLDHLLAEGTSQRIEIRKHTWAESQPIGIVVRGVAGDETIAPLTIPWSTILNHTPTAELTAEVARRTKDIRPRSP